MYKSSVLSNGMRVVTDSVPGMRSVSVGVLVAASPQDEPSDKAGLAHFTEHAFFQGTSGRDAAAISRMIDEAGGQMGAFTSRDYTCFYANILQDYCPFALDLLGDVLLNSTFPEDSLVREREAVIQEIDLQSDNPSSRLHDLLKRRIWPRHPLGRPVAGDVGSVQNLTREDVIYFVGQNYLPDRMIMAAAGAVDHDDMVSQAQDAFWRMLGTSAPQGHSLCEFEPVVLLEEGPVGQSYFALAVPAFAYCDSRRYSVHVLNTILGGGISSRLHRKLRESHGLVYYVQSDYQAYRDAGVLIVEGVTAPENLTPVLDMTLLEIEQLARYGVDEEELWKAKMQMRGQHLLAADSVHTRMSRLATQTHYFGSFLDEDDVLRGIDSVEASAVQEAASHLFESGSGQSFAAIGPASAPYTMEQLEDKMQAHCVLHV